MYEFVCPHCSIPLRVRDESFRNRTIPCPECRQPVRIQDSPQGLVCLPGEPGSPAESTSSPFPSRRKLTTGRTLIGGLTACTLVAVLLFVLSRQTVDPPQPELTNSPAPAPEKLSAPQPAETSRELETTVQTPAGGEPQDPLERQLQEIFRLTRVPGKTSRPVPSQAPAAGGLSWIASLAASCFPESHPHWDQNWNAAANDEFVRRRFPLFDNPRIPQKAGEDNYPATHFVGVSGIGADAADLPRTHPRAGAFTSQGPARPAEFTDGLSNTMLIAGVESQLGSWASPGRATVRSFNREPYVHGPDGFGTGQPDQMHVLMADGSIRTLSTKTDPVIVRRMAAIADGIPLSPAVPGDPLTLPSTAVSSPAMPKAAPLDAGDSPLLVELVPELPMLDLKPRLAQKIALFETARPVPLRQILGDVQELIGVPLDTVSLPVEILDRPVTISLQEMTAEDILRKLAAIAGISCEILKDRIQFTVVP